MDGFMSIKPLRVRTICLLIIIAETLTVIPVYSVTTVDPGKRLREMQEYYDKHIYRRSTENEEKSPTQMMNLKGGEDLEKVTSVKTVDGLIKTKLQETYKGLEVFGEIAVIGQKENGNYKSASGQLVEGIENEVPDVNPTISVPQALAIAVSDQKDKPEVIKFNGNRDAKLVIFISKRVKDSPLIQTNVVKDPKEARLAYMLSYRVETDSKQSRPYYVIDAKTGKIIDKWQSIETQSCSHLEHASKYESIGGNFKTGLKKFDGKAFPKLVVDREGDTCYFDNYAARVIDMMSNMTVARLGYNKTFVYDCNKRFNDSINGGYSPLSDVLYAATVMHDMYQQWYNTTPLKSKIVARVHFKKNLENANWNGRYVSFGDGFKTFYPLTSLDIIGHEIGHGVVSQNSGLIYKGQSGGMNEAFGDMSGEATEYFATGKVDWLIGGDVTKKRTALRYFRDPTRDGNSIKHASRLLICGDINVHYSSGVYNRVFYTLAHKPKWNVKKAYDVMVLANKLYWRPNSDFGDGACGAVKAAVDLGYNAQDVREAFVSAGVAPCQSDLLLFSDLKGNKNSPVILSWTIPENAHFLYLRTTQGRGNVNLCVKKGSIPKNGACNVSSTNKGNEEKILLKNPPPGKYYISLSSPTSFSGVGLIAKSSSKGKNLVENLDSCGNRNLKKWLRLTFTAPANISAILFKGKTETGNIMVGIRHGARVAPPYGFDKLLMFQKLTKTYLLCKPKAGVYHTLMGYGRRFNGTTITYSYREFPRIET